MFDTMNIAKRIKQARIDKNMTQMNLADAMGVSFQAVSNWERGNSMPDISKLADLCAALDLTVNELLGIDAPAVTKVMEEQELTVEELAEAAPILPPADVKDKAEKVRKKKKLKLDKIADMAPFLDQEYLDELVAEADPDDYDGIDELAPFLSQAALEKLVERAEPDSLEDLAEIAPFLGREAVDKLAIRCAECEELDALEGLAPFASKEGLDSLVDRYIESESDAEFPDIYPFLSKESVRKLARYKMRHMDLDALEDMMPFM